MEQINQFVAQIDQINQKAAAAAEENAGASGSLNSLSGNLMEQIDNLGSVMKTIVGGAGLPARSHRPAPSGAPAKPASPPRAAGVNARFAGCAPKRERHRGFADIH